MHKLNVSLNKEERSPQSRERARWNVTRCDPFSMKRRKRKSQTKKNRERAGFRQVRQWVNVGVGDPLSPAPSNRTQCVAVAMPRRVRAT